MARFKVGFVAFPAAPADLANTITGAVQRTEDSPRVRISAWPQLEIFGAAIPDEVRSGIEKADVLICDVTRPNLNVYYEIGFSIGKRKSIAPTVNVSFRGAVEEIQKDGLFDIIGYRTYENSHDLSSILLDLPEHVLLDLYGKPLNPHQPIYFLNAYRKTDFIAEIAASIKDSKVHFRSFDPAEISRFSTVQIISDLTSSAGVVIPFLASHIDDAERHNIRASFLAGLAHGLGRSTLLLKDGSVDSRDPADFRELVEAFKGEGLLRERVISFATQTLIDAQSIRTPQRARGETRLQRITFGAIAAENEFRTLEDYFVETSEFLRTVRGEVEMVAGRKGSGKTAIFFMVRDSFRKVRGSVVVDLRPESHQLSLFRGELLKILETGAFDHTLAAFWYFVILSEVLLAIKKDFDFRQSRTPARIVELDEIERALRNLEISEAGDFTARINRLGSYVLKEIKELAKNGRKVAHEQLTNVIFKSGIAEAKSLVVKHTASAPHIVFLFDNIDKGWATNGVEAFDVRLVRLLIEAMEKVRRDLGASQRSFIPVVFLRNDVYELLVDETPDRGKAAVVRIDWTDRAKLKQVIHRRLQASLDDWQSDFSSLWSRVFVASVDGGDAFEYLVDHCLMRPRFLINILEYAVANAINRGHDLVSAEDCMDAVKQHSNYLLNEFGYEIRDVSGLSARILHSLVGTTRYVTRAEVLDRFVAAGIADENLKRAFYLMLWYGVLGVVTTSGTERFIYDFEYNMNRLEAEIDFQRDEPLFVINRALHVALESD